MVDDLTLKCLSIDFCLNALWVIYKNSLDYQVTATGEILRWHVEPLFIHEDVHNFS